MGRGGYKDFILQFDAESGDWTQVGSTNTKTAFIGVDLVPLSEVQPYCDMVSRNNRAKDLYYYNFIFRLLQQHKILNLNLNQVLKPLIINYGLGIEVFLNDFWFYLQS